MARIAGVDIPREKRVEIALTYIFGIGLPTATKILTQTNVNAGNLPVRGQRTKTNARQRRGPKKTVGVRRKK